MNFFDLHCDTIGECANRNLPLRENALHISLEKGSYFDSWIQVFAIWMPDEKRGSEAADYFDRVYDYYLKELETNDSLLINSTPINVSLTYKDMNTSVVSSKTSAKDIIASQRLSLIHI